MNEITEEHSHSTEKIVWILCDVYGTGTGIPGVFQISVFTHLFVLESFWIQKSVFSSQKNTNQVYVTQIYSNL